MDTDRIDLLHQPYFKHVVEPCGIDRTHSPQQHLLAMFVDDISRLPHKIPEDPPVRIEPVVVLTGVVGFIPEFYPFEVVTIEVQNLLCEIGNIFWMARGSGCSGSDTYGGRGRSEEDTSELQSRGRRVF